MNANEKSSLKTEESALDQTFGGFDDDMTTATVEPSQMNTVNVVEKKSSTNMILFIGLGVAAIAVILWMFVLSPSRHAPVQANAPYAGSVANQPVIASTAPVAPNTTTSAATPPVATTTTVDSPESKTASQFLAGNSPPEVTPASTTTTTTTTPSTTVAVTTSTDPAPAVSTTVATPSNTVTQTTVTQTPATQVATSSNTVVTELGKLFENQSKEFKSAINSVGTRVDTLEKFKDDQQSINSNINARLVKLEDGNFRKVASASNSTKVTNKKVAKTNVETSEVVERRMTVSSRESTTASREPMVEYNVHSIFGNRVWFKNTDGSLSTYAAGDTLPSGEVIKNVDVEKFAVTTDKRTFVKK